MARKEIKQLSLVELQKQNKVLDEQKEMTIEINGQKYKLNYDVVFRQSKKSKLLNDMVKYFRESATNLELFELATPYTTMLIFKHFTTLEVSDDISEALDLMTTLIDLEIFDKILMELPETEITSIFELITKTVNVMANNLKEAEAEIEKLNEMVENPEVKEMISDGEE